MVFLLGSANAIATVRPLRGMASRGRRRMSITSLFFFLFSLTPVSARPTLIPQHLAFHGPDDHKTRWDTEPPLLDLGRRRDSPSHLHTATLVRHDHTFTPRLLTAFRSADDLDRRLDGAKRGTRCPTPPAPPPLRDSVDTGGGDSTRPSFFSATALPGALATANQRLVTVVEHASPDAAHAPPRRIFICACIATRPRC